MLTTSAVSISFDAPSQYCVPRHNQECADDAGVVRGNRSAGARILSQCACRGVSEDVHLSLCRGRDEVGDPMGAEQPAAHANAANRMGAEQPAAHANAANRNAANRTGPGRSGHAMTAAACATGCGGTGGN